MKLIVGRKRKTWVWVFIDKNMSDYAFIHDAFIHDDTNKNWHIILTNIHGNKRNDNLNNDGKHTMISTINISIVSLRTSNLNQSLQMLSFYQIIVCYNFPV